MPRKTRKEKILADIRHRQNVPFLTKNTFEAPQQSEATSPGEYHYDVALTIHKQRTAPSPVIRSDTLAAMRKDMTKTIFLAFLAFTAELVLYWQLVVRH